MQGKIIGGITSVQNHLEGIEIGLYNLLRGQLTPYLISVEAIQQGLDKLKGTVMKKGFLLSTYNYNEALQLEASFASITNGTIFALLHIPAFKSISTLYIYRYIPIPIASNGNGSSSCNEKAFGSCGEKSSGRFKS